MRSRADEMRALIEANAGYQAWNTLFADVPLGPNRMTEIGQLLNQSLDNEGNTALHLAAQKVSAKLVEAILSCSPDIQLDKNNNAGQTPLNILSDKKDNAEGNDDRKKIQSIMSTINTKIREKGFEVKKDGGILNADRKTQEQVVKNLTKAGKASCESEINAFVKDQPGQLFDQASIEKYAGLRKNMMDADPAKGKKIIPSLDDQVVNDVIKQVNKLGVGDNLGIAGLRALQQLLGEKNPKNFQKIDKAIELLNLLTESKTNASRARSEPVRPAASVQGTQSASKSEPPANDHSTGRELTGREFIESQRRRNEASQLASYQAPSVVNLATPKAEQDKASKDAVKAPESPRLK